MDGEGKEGVTKEGTKGTRRAGTRARRAQQRAGGSDVRAEVCNGQGVTAEEPKEREIASEKQAPVHVKWPHCPICSLCARRVVDGRWRLSTENGLPRRCRFRPRRRHRQSTLRVHI